MFVCLFVSLGATPVNGAFVVKLADFGLSRRVQVKQQAINLRKTTSGMRLFHGGSVPVPAKGTLTPACSMQLQRIQRCALGKAKLLQIEPAARGNLKQACLKT
jgi:hypothetical protein